MNIIKAEMEHLDKAAELFDGYRQFYGQEPDAESGKKFLKERIEKKDSVIFIAQDAGGNGMGFVQLYPLLSSVAMMRVWLLNDLYVKEEFRKHGVASALMEKAEEFGRSTGAKFVFLETARDNNKAQKLYEKLGWERDEEHFIYFKEV